VPNWSHSKKEIRSALDDADEAGFRVTPMEAHGHSWGYIDCVGHGCDGRFYVWSTPEDEDIHARKIRRFIRRHDHGES
jgi:hypothetical protein